MAFAETTTVPVEKSRAEIERLCMRHGCSQFLSGVDYENHTARVQFKARERIVRFELTLPKRDGYRREKEYEQASRTKWRALLLVIKGKLESVESGIATFEEEFMPYIVMPNDVTLGVILAPIIESAYTDGIMPRQFLIGDGSK